MIYAIFNSSGCNFKIGQRINSNDRIYFNLNGWCSNIGPSTRTNKKYFIVEFPEDAFDGESRLLKNAIVVFSGTPNKIAKTDFANKINFDSKGAYLWAKNIGNHDIMINKITESEYAYMWAKNIGNRDIMINKITESEYAYYWALFIGDHDVMIDKITESKDAYNWAYHIGNQDVMIDKITDSSYAYLWALKFGNHDVMINRIADSRHAYEWAFFIGDRDVMIDRITDSEYAYYWALNIGNRDVMIDKITDSQWAYLWARDIGNYDIMIPKISDPHLAISLSVSMLNNLNDSKHQIIDQLFQKIQTTSDVLKWNVAHKQPEKCKDAIVEILKRDGILPENIIDILTWNKNNPNFEIKYNFSII